MPRITDITSKRHWPACVTAGVFLTATLVFGTFAAASASAEEHQGNHWGNHRVDRHWDNRWGHHDYPHNGWSGGYYRAPPVVYGPQYYAPPVVYGPGIGLNLNFR
jgi:hypothetical protein